jgi:hypothetical protein
MNSVFDSINKISFEQTMQNYNFNVSKNSKERLESIYGNRTGKGGKEKGPRPVTVDANS